MLHTAGIHETLFKKCVLRINKGFIEFRQTENCAEVQNQITGSLHILVCIYFYIHIFIYTYVYTAAHSSLNTTQMVCEIELLKT